MTTVSLVSIWDTSGISTGRCSSSADSTTVSWLVSGSVVGSGKTCSIDDWMVVAATTVSSTSSREISKTSTGSSDPLAIVFSGSSHSGADCGPGSGSVFSAGIISVEDGGAVSSVSSRLGAEVSAGRSEPLASNRVCWGSTDPAVDSWMVTGSL